MGESASISLSEVLKEKYVGGSVKNLAGNRLLELSDDIILAWSKEDGCLFSQVLNPSNSKVQTLALSKPPVWDVKKILINANKNCVALVGQRGVAVVELPRRYGNSSLFDGGRDIITCRVEYIAERFFSCHPKLEVVSASWHPGLVDHNYIVILASDNYLRIYNLSSQEIPEQAILVAPNANILNTSTYGHAASLGETAVDFGFGLPTKQAKRVCGNPVSGRPREDIIDPEEDLKRKYLDLQWPVFILYGNGDIYFVNTVLGPNRPPFHSVYGPLSMTPQCEDNYGVDSCSLLVLQSSPPVIIIATSMGQLHQCIVVDGENKDDSFDHSSIHNGSRLGVPTSVNLHVYESIELELSLLPDDEGYTSPLLLHADSTSNARYWVSHEAGVHGVTFPLVEHLSQDIEALEDSIFPANESQSIVEHIICTRSLSTAAPMPIIGLISNTLNTLYILIASGVILTCNQPTGSVPQNLHNELASPTPATSPLKKVHTESFEDYIRNVLHRSSSQPLLASGSNADVSSKEYLNLLQRVKETLQVNYIKPQRTAHHHIVKRSEILKEQHQRLRSEISDLQNMKKELTEKAHELAEKYEEANDRKAQLTGRLERILTQVMRGIPGLSRAEKNMLEELEAMDKHRTNLSNQLNQIEEKAKWQTSQMEKLQNNENSKYTPSSNLTETQVKKLCEALGKEGEKIGILVEKVNQIKQELHL